MSYESPIKLLQDKIQFSIDGEIIKAVQNVVVDVSKEELIKALEYDRGQYQKGFEDGKRESYQWIPVSERLPQASKHILFSVKGKSYTSYGFHNDGIWTDINGAWYTDKEVNAWMPLPEQYKESEGE